MRITVAVDIISRSGLARIVGITECFDHYLIVALQFRVDIATHMGKATSTIATNHSQDIFLIMYNAYSRLEREVNGEEINQ